MNVSDRIREIEREIDDNIRQLPIWQKPKDEVLNDLMCAYRDAMEVIFCVALSFKVCGGSLKDFGIIANQENNIRSGILWALKWAAEYCPIIGATVNRNQSTRDLSDLIPLGISYEAFVDALKYAKYNLIEIKVDEASQTIFFYEGGPSTKFDSNIINHQRITSPFTPYISLTKDSDQLTMRWPAGAYRQLTKQLSNYAAQKEDTISIDPAFLAQLGKVEGSISQPTLIWLDRPTGVPDCYVFDDLVLPSNFDFDLKWKLVSLLDTPIIQVGERFCSLSSDLKTIALLDDYMLRLAVRIDPDQYSTATRLREERMIEICRNVLEECNPPWVVASHVICKNPPQEVDILASRDAQTLILQLKSTLRPETPWEVFKRNEEIIKGIKHTRKLVDRGIAKLGFVVTNGYRGDFSCWAEGLDSDIPIATLDDLELIASNPDAAVSVLKSRVGITNSIPEHLQEIPDR